MSLTLPAFEQVLELRAQREQVIVPEFIDINAHMNISRYMELGDQGLWDRAQNELGMPIAYVQERGLTTFTAEQHLTYLAEMVLGDHASVHTQIIARSDKVLHGLALIVNRTRRQLACIMEATMIHVDMAMRRPCPFPDDVASLIDQAIATDTTAWAPPVTGHMVVRNRT